MPSLVEDLRFRGLIHQWTDDGLGARLDAGGMTAYSGFDPTADSLTIGHLLQICNLRRLQDAGHRPIALAGGGTGFVGDPGGKSEERNLLAEDEVRANVEAIRRQLARFLDFDPARGTTTALLLNNADWLEPLSLVQFLRGVGKHFTVNQMVAKDSVRARFERADQGISYTEFSYMLLQAYDFLVLFRDHGCRLQLGGSDQWGNITLGIELVRKVERAESWGLTTPLVLKPDGTKFGKTESGAVWLDATRTSPYQLHQFLLRTEDSVVGTYLRYLTFLDHAELLALDAATADHPERRDAQRALARAVTTLVHGEAETDRAERAATALFGEEVATLDERTLLDVFAEAPSLDVARDRLAAGGVSLVDALVESGLCASRGQSRTMVAQGGVAVNNRRQDDVDRVLDPTDLLADRYLVLRRGKREYRLLRFD